MKILVTGAKGFVGRNLVENLKCIRDGKNTITSLDVNEVYEYDLDSPSENLESFCKDCDFVFNFAGSNRPKEDSEYMKANCEFISQVIDELKRHNNICPIMMASSIQATLIGRFKDSEYGRSKLAGEKLVFEYAKETGAKIFIYRFPNLFGKWCRPNYNSVVATFCDAFANDLPYVVDDAQTEIELLYIDDLIDEMYNALKGKEHRCIYPKEGERINGTTYDGVTPLANTEGDYCYATITHKVKLKTIIDLLKEFKQQPESLMIPTIPDGSFEKKLYSTYLSYLPNERTIYDLNTNIDERGSFAEIFKYPDIGQFSVNVTKPGKVRGVHWHNTKAEIFVVVSGYGLVQERKIGINPENGEYYPIREYEVSGERLQCIYMLPGYTHCIKNLSDKDNLVTIMWANEVFSSHHPETYHEEVVV